MKQKFDLSLWLKDKSRKVVTRDGRPVRIICTDRKTSNNTNVIGLAKNPYDVEQLLVCNTDGQDVYKEIQNDLLFADEEEELTEFENALLAAFNCVTGKAVMTINQPISFQEDVNEWSKALLGIARKELKNNDWRQSLMSYKNGYEQGKQDVLKDLPKWHHSDNIVEPKELYVDKTKMLYYKNYMIPIDIIFEKLPKEE